MVQNSNSMRRGLDFSGTSNQIAPRMMFQYMCAAMLFFKSPVSWTRRPYRYPPKPRPRKSERDMLA